MTREEYFYKLEETQAFLYFNLKPMDEERHNKWINHIFYLLKQESSKIFDDHEAVIKALQQPKSCEGCKYFDRFKCLNKHSIAFESRYGVCDSDGCNKYEEKVKQWR